MNLFIGEIDFRSLVRRLIDTYHDRLTVWLIRVPNGADDEPLLTIIVYKQLLINNNAAYKQEELFNPEDLGGR